MDRMLGLQILTDQTNLFVANSPILKLRDGIIKN